jgi:hypothetical protein
MTHLCNINRELCSLTAAKKGPYRRLFDRRCVDLLPNRVESLQLNRHRGRIRRNKREAQYKPEILCSFYHSTSQDQKLRTHSSKIHILTVHRTLFLTRKPDLPLESSNSNKIQTMTSTLPIPSPSEPLLTPNTRSEAEAALTFNATVQTASAAAPQATTPPARPPLHTRNSSNYATAASYANLSFEPPYPTEDTAEAVRGNLSRGTTQAVLERITSPTSVSPEETLLSKRASREGERRTSKVAADGGRPEAYQRQSYSAQDLKRVMSEKLMGDDKPEASGDATGYDTVR